VNGGAKDRLIVALDLPSAREALALVDRLEGSCRWFKVGMQLFYSQTGDSRRQDVIVELRERGFDVFLDLKLHDIPNTVAGAVRSLEDVGASLLTVHAGGGAAMLEAAREAVRSPNLRLLAVTVLTSMDAAQLEAVGVAGGTSPQVLRLGRLAKAAGMDGLVCSAEEIGVLRAELGEETLLVVPGIRPAGAAVGDQRRVASPGEALRRGASMLVVGRPINQAADPARAAQTILAEMDEALERSSLTARDTEVRPGVPQDPLTASRKV